jgi:hypothetical protein
LNPILESLDATPYIENNTPSLINHQPDTINPDAASSASLRGIRLLGERELLSKIEGLLPESPG